VVTGKPRASLDFGENGVALCQRLLLRDEGDANGVYLTSNYFSFADGSFQGVSLVALSKASLVSGAGVSGAPYVGLTGADGRPALSPAPATTPPRWRAGSATSSVNTIEPNAMMKLLAVASSQAGLPKYWL